MTDRPDARIAEAVRDLVADWADHDSENLTGEDAEGILLDLARILRPVNLPTWTGATIYAIPMGSQYGRDDEVELVLCGDGQWESPEARFNELELLTQFHNHRVPKWHVRNGANVPEPNAYEPVEPDTEEAARAVANALNARARRAGESAMWSVATPNEVTA